MQNRKILHYRVLDKSLKNGLRYLHDDNGIRDLVYRYLHGGEVYVFVDYYGDDEDKSTH